MQWEAAVASFRRFMAVAFSLIFFVLALALTITTAHTILQGLSGDAGLTEAFLKAVNLAVVALAILELGLVVNMEYACDNGDNHPIGVVLSRTLPRFVSIVCIALVLEGLLMVIKYSQLELAGNLYYPVAVIVSASVLLFALGFFLRFSGVASSDKAVEHFRSIELDKVSNGPVILNPRSGERIAGRECS